MTRRGKHLPPAKTGATPPGTCDPARVTDLSADERALWRHVTRSVAPVTGKPRVRVHGLDDGGTVQPAPLVRRPARRAGGNDPAERKPLPPPVKPPLPNKGRPAPPLGAFDPRKAKKLGSGRADIEARLDLHGLRQDDALDRLRGFLRECHARGLKTVLVITGKGRATDDRFTSFADTQDRQPRGVLRRNVPRWLDEPESRTLVVSYTTAAPKHGGDGAFYVELRKRGR